MDACVVVIFPPMVGVFAGTAVTHCENAMSKCMKLGVRAITCQYIGSIQ